MKVGKKRKDVDKDAGVKKKMKLKQDKVIHFCSRFFFFFSSLTLSLSHSLSSPMFSRLQISSSNLLGVLLRS